METRKATLEKQGANSSLEIERAVLIAKRDNLFSRLQDLYDRSKKTSDERDLNYFLSGMISIDNIRDKFSETVNKINIIELTINPLYTVNFECMNAFEDMYCHSKYIFEKFNKSVAGSNGLSDSNTQRRSFRLPKLDLMMFNGDVIKWPIFHESFKRTIHENPDLTDHERIQYLISKLSDSALSVCAGIIPNAENYALIWQTLIDKYHDKRSLGSAYMQKILDFKPLTTASHKNLQLFLDNYCTAISSLESLQLENLADFILLYLSCKKLDSSTIRSFELHNMNNPTIPSYKDLIAFVREHNRIAQHLDPTRTFDNKPVSSRAFVSLTEKQSSCSFCKRIDHFNLYKCNSFKELSIEDKYTFIKNNKGCFNCLSLSHMLNKCKSAWNCRHCRMRHHSTLCRNATVSQENIHPNNLNRMSNATAQVAVPPANNTPYLPARSDNQPINNSNISLCNIRPAISESNNTCLLGTAQVLIYGLNGKPHSVRVLIDCASQSTFITMKCCRRLNLKVNKFSNKFVKGIGSASNPIIGEVSIVLSSRINNNSLSLNAFAIDKITDSLPVSQINMSSLKHLNNITLADENYFYPSEVDILIGAPQYAEIMLSGRVTGAPGTPTAFETIFGYIIIGNVPLLSSDCTNNYNSCTAISLCSLVEQPQLESLIQKFWHLEEVQCSVPLSPDAIKNERIFTNTVSRDSTGRYTVMLPFSENLAVLGDSYDMAKQFRLEYDAIIKEYINKGYISLLENDNKNQGYYIPHHAVARLDKTSTRWRMVMDASAKTSSGLSLNDILYTGDSLQSDLFNIMLDFRLYKFAFIADIKQMYLQVCVSENDRKYLKILFRFNSTSPLHVYQFNRVCFGLRCSPYLAMRVLRQLCYDEKVRFPNAIPIIENNTYVDDVCYSVPSLPFGLKLCEELRELVRLGGFELVKWASNTSELIENLSSSDNQLGKIDFDGSENNLKVLGLQWSPTTDEFTYAVSINHNNHVTKRNILSLIARQFDVLGLIAPVILYAKLIIQQLHLLKIGWDEPLPSAIVDVWQVYIRELPCLRQLRVQRHLGVEEKSTISIIAFADASEKAYGTTVYLKTNKPLNSPPIIRLVCAKSKVAPLKTISVARLELCACLLMAKLAQRVIDTYKKRHVINDIFCFTDSMVALHWISASPHRFKTFIATRITKIVSHIRPEKFHHVAGDQNPSDCLSRGMSPTAFVNNSVWFTGPKWLELESSEWPITSVNSETAVDVEEERKIVSIPATVWSDPNPILELSHRVSSWLLFLRTVVWIYRFLKRLPRSTSISADDINFAEIQIFKVLQKVYFSDVIHNIKTSGRCSRSIQRLCPFLDSDGLIRVGGRLKNANLQYDHQHPILLPQKDRIIELIISYYHNHNCHVGPVTLMAILRQRFWILSCRSIVRSIIHKCNFCFKANPQPTIPLMGDLPDYRVNESNAFVHTAVDYAGPISIIPYRKRGVRSMKAYLCIFVCMVVRAVHVELTTDLSTSSFLSAFKRFIARRGSVFVLYSDNAKNFVGAKNALSDIFTLTNSNEFRETFATELSNNRIQWKFNPPRSPHFGGCFEIFVKAFKNHLRRVVGEQLLTYEEMLTVLTQIESVINSRPLTLLSEDPSELTALTPAHFLMSSPLKFLPAKIKINDEPLSLLKRFALLDGMVQSFSNRWKVEYLHLLQSRTKWNTQANPVTIGTIVVIVTDNVSPLSWPLGKVMEIYPGKDGVCRVVLVKTATGVYKRPVVRLCPLPNQ
ncbi:uncharacterized protein LOC125053303 [Pieris napi]|uniref:uncharacterized protein LOC125053303 n=1 Tax=Pieris napi TaxID=78633 RepID=UPI001FBAC407|nr:uncharacterized protein LOC125053303 [Pieris napi]